MQNHCGALNNVSLVCNLSSHDFLAQQAPRETWRTRALPIKTASGGLQHGPFISPQTEERIVMGEGPRGLVSSHFTSQYLQGWENLLKEPKHTDTCWNHVRCIKDQHVFKNNINFNRTPLGWGSAVNFRLADSCRYLEPDVVILGLGQGRGRGRCEARCDDGRKEIKRSWNLETLNLGWL